MDNGNIYKKENLITLNMLSILIKQRYQYKHARRATLERVNKVSSNEKTQKSQGTQM